MILQIGQTTLARGMPLLAALAPDGQDGAAPVISSVPNLYLSGRRVDTVVSSYSFGGRSDVAVAFWANTGDFPLGHHSVSVEIDGLRDELDCPDELWVLTEDQYASMFEELHEEDFNDDIGVSAGDLERSFDSLIAEYPSLAGQVSPQETARAEPRITFFARSVLPTQVASCARVNCAIHAVASDLAYIAPLLVSSQGDESEAKGAVRVEIDMLGGAKVIARAALVRPLPGGLVQALIEHSNIAQLNKFGRGEFRAELRVNADEGEIHLSVDVERGRGKMQRQYPALVESPESEATQEVSEVTAELVR